jgi:glycosyltransferase involved in cell wall biosynthesis
MANAPRLATAGHVSFHGAGPGISRIAGRLVACARRTGATLSVRVFGGMFKKYYLHASPGEQKRIAFVLERMEAVFLETQEQVSFFSTLAPRCCWLPNSRPAHPEIPTRMAYAGRFVFVGVVRPEKGVREVIELGERLGPDYRIDVFGPMQGGVSGADFVGKRAQYRGVLSPENVAATIAGYDALLLPTDYAGEGQPGVIVEALSVGVPSIASRFAGIPEVVVDRQTGYLVAPRSATALEAAIREYERQNIEVMRTQCRQRFELFDSARQARVFLRQIGIEPGANSRPDTTRG